jgi:excisionase family DNA binding protein
MLLSKLQDLLGETTGKRSVVEMIALTEELGTSVRVKAQDDFAAIGLTLKSFYIGNLKPSDKSLDELRSMGMLDVETYTRLQAADAIRDAAKNPSGGAGLTAGLGAGMGLGGVISDTLKGMNTSGGGSSGDAMVIPAVMTPADVAKILKVAEEDVLKAIADKSLTAKKIGLSYRISKESLEKFLKS